MTSKKGYIPKDEHAYNLLCYIKKWASKQPGYKTLGLPEPGTPEYRRMIRLYLRDTWSPQLERRINQEQGRLANFEKKRQKRIRERQEERERNRRREEEDRRRQGDLFKN